jgi:NAD-dependent deacetylase
MGEGWGNEQEREKTIDRIAQLVVHALPVVVFTGAGVSTESGIPDFRSPGGLWSRFDPEDFTIDRFLTSPETRKRQWRFLFANEQLRDAQPNEAHAAIAEFERLGLLDCVITQNIDNLHQKAGNDPARVYELHGNMRRIRCLGCDEAFALDGLLRAGAAAGEVPACPFCGGLLKPDVVFFGEALPEKTLTEATRRAAACDLMIVVGSSLVVYPAAALPAFAKQAGARLVIVNLSPTPLDEAADLVIRAPAGEVMGRLLTRLKEIVQGV